ncbi:MAG: hypothetical protein HKO62_12370 [Gammaproteobacteria bacterium]|nr:hypothetical protein [Gammaproteobacteria bacterium]
MELKSLRRHALMKAHYTALRLLKRERPGAQRVAMFHIGRVGSTVLARQLGQHPDIRWHGEIFEPEHKKFTANHGKRPYRMPRDPLWKLRYALYRQDRRWLGFEMKFMPQHHLKLTNQTMEEFLETLTGLGFSHYIVLRRRNLLRRFVSGAILERTRRAHRPEGGAAPRNRINFDCDRIPLGEFHLPLLEAIDIVDAQHRRLDQLLVGREALQLCYEDDIETDPGEAYLKVCEFLRVPPAAVDIPLKRVNPYPLPELIENYDELESLLADTEHAWMLRA